MGAVLCLRESPESYGRPLRAVLDRDSAHEALVAIARRRAGDDVALLEPLLIAAESRAYELLGLASIQEYCARLFGWGGRQTRERLRVANAMRWKMLFDAFLRGSEAGERESSPHQVKLTVCDPCGATARESGAEGLVPVDPVVGEVALCDAQVLRAGERAAQTVPPATRRAVLRRDEGKCAVPGCRHAAFVDVHHIERQVEGGGHDLANLVSLCSVHHDAAHRGRLVVRRHEGERRFERADGQPYGAIAGAADTARCASASRHFEAIVAATGSERFAREALRPGAGYDPVKSPDPTARVAPRSQPAEPALREEVARLLTSMGYRRREAEWLLERAFDGGELLAGRTPSKVEVLRAALRAGPPHVEERNAGRRRR